MSQINRQKEALNWLVFAAVPVSGPYLSLIGPIYQAVCGPGRVTGAYHVTGQVGPLPTRTISPGSHCWRGRGVCMGVGGGGRGNL